MEISISKSCVPAPRRASQTSLGVRVSRAFLLLAMLPACSASLPSPPTGRVPIDGMIEVPYPPPVARVETVPEQKHARDVWIDGQWEWNGKAWSWLPGAWVTPPANAYFTAWTTARRSDGRLFFAPAAWRAPDGHVIAHRTGKDICAPEPPGRRGQ